MHADLAWIYRNRFFDGAMRLSQWENIMESRPLPMLRMLLASTLRWIIPDLKLKLAFSTEFTHGEFKNKTIQGRASASWPVTNGITLSFSTSAGASSRRRFRR
jgi:hypothetical protein